jgi:hypothetical protein
VYVEKVSIQTDTDVYHAGERIWFAVFVDDAHTNTPSTLSRLAYIQLADSSGNTVVKAIIALKQGRGEGYMDIPITTLPSTYTLVATTRWMRNFSSLHAAALPLVVVNGYSRSTPVRSAAQRVQPPANEIDLKITTDKPVYQHRSPVLIDVSAAGAHLKSPAEYIVSVTLADDIEPDNITAAYAKPLPDSQEFHYRFAPEITGRWITGSVKYSGNNSPAINRRVYAVVPGYAAGFYNGITDSSGRFAIRMNEVITGDSLIVLTNPLDSTGSISLDNPFLDSIELASIVYKPSGAKPVDAQKVTTVRDVVEIHRAYPAVSYSSPQNSVRDTGAFYGRPDLVYRLDDYTRFPTIEEVFREYVQLVSVNKRGGRFHLSVFNEPYGKLLEKDPLVLLDGYPVFDLNRLFAFDPLRVEQLHVVTRRFLRGTEVFEGIINLVTYSRNMNGFAIDNNALLFNDQLAQKRNHFVAPDYASAQTKGSRLPDFRRLLFWNPGLMAEGGRFQIQVFTSDLAGKYVIEVHARAADGKRGSARSYFEVRPGPAD